MSRVHRRVAALALAVLSVVTLAAAPVAARAPRPDARLREAVRSAVGPGVEVTWNRATRHPAALSGTEVRPVATAASLGSPATPLGAAQAFLARHGDLFGIDSPARELRVSRREADDDRTFVRYQQIYRGLPVLAGELVIQVGPRNQIISVHGRTSPSLDVATRPAISAGEARRRAIAVTARQEQVKASSLRAGPAHLMIYDSALTGDPRALPGGRLGWQVDVRSDRRAIDELVVIEATRGGVLAAIDRVAAARPPATARQRICDLRGVRATGGEGSTDPLQCDPADPTLVRSPGTSRVADVRSAHRYTQDTYAFFARRFGRDSLDGKGMTLISTVRYCDESPAIACPLDNAFWNGFQMTYGTGYARVDDVVAHELTHGLTQHTSRLLYWFQSGAINESLSDIFGEFVDQTNRAGSDARSTRWLLGEDLPGGAGRDMKDPPASRNGASPDRMRSGHYFADPTLRDNGGVHRNSGVGNKAAYLITQGGSFNGRTVKGIGLDKAAALYYRVATRLLASGSDYTDLGAMLNQACSDLIGRTPRNGAGRASSSGRFTRANCGQVRKAVLATEMALDPVVATASHAPLCETGSATSTPFRDPIKADMAGWTASGTPGIWGDGMWLATSRRHALWATDTTAFTDASVRSPGIAIPAGGTTHLAFRNYFSLQNWNNPFVGGVVEYATSVEGPWTDMGPLFTFNGYNGTIATGNGNPLEGRPAFTGFSFGFGVTKADLTSLAGQTIFLRFRIGTDSEPIGFDGWVVDDVRVYQCR